MQNLGRVLFVVNPAAQNGKGALGVDFLARAKQTYAQAFERFDVQQTSEAGHAKAIAENAADYDVVITWGGDGVMHEVVNGLHTIPRESRPAFGLVPCGNGNDYARTLGMPFEFQAAFEMLLQNRRKTFDLGICNGEVFAETLSFGLDAAIAIGTQERRERTGATGTGLFVAEGLNQLLHHLDPYKFVAVLDGERAIDDTMAMFAVQNGVTYGGGFAVCPDADPTDGSFDLCYAKAPMSLFVAGPLFLRAKNGGHVGSKRIVFDRCSTLHIEFDTEPPTQLDGERFQGRVFDVSIDRAALDVIVGSRG